MTGPTDSAFPMDRRGVLAGLAALAAGGACPSVLRAEADPLTVWGMPATPSAVFARAVASDRFQRAAPGARFALWKSTDQMRAGVVSGRFGLFGSSTYAAANFFNRGAGTRMVNVVSWGVLYVMARDEAIRSVADLAGRRVLLSNRHEAPDLLFRLILRWAGLDPDRDVTRDYVGSPGEAVPLFLAGRGDVAVLHEPAASVALLRGAAAGVPVFRALDLARLYGEHTGRGARIPQVGLAVGADLAAAAPDLVDAAHAACVEAGAWAQDNPDAAGAETGPALGLDPHLVARSLPFVHLDVVSAQAARAEIEVYFRALMELAPGIVGDRLPEADFYWG